MLLGMSLDLGQRGFKCHVGGLTDNVFAFVRGHVGYAADQVAHLCVVQITCIRSFGKGREWHILVGKEYIYVVTLS